MILKSISLAKFIEKEKIPFYVEHDDYIKAGLHVNEEVDELLAGNFLGLDEAQECRSNNSVWSARFYFNDEYKIAYAATFENVLNKIIAIMEEHYEISL